MDSSLVRSSQTIENTPSKESPKDQDYDFDQSFQKFLEEKVIFKLIIFLETNQGEIGLNYF